MSYNSREEYINAITTQLKEWNSKIELLNKKAEGAGEEKKLKWKKNLEDFNKKKEIVKQRMNKLNAASEASWAEVKAGFETAWGDLKTAFTRAKSDLE